MTTVLCMHHRPDDFRGVLEDRFPDLTITYAATNAEIEEELSARPPEVVFSIKGPEFPGNLHHKAVTAPSVAWIHVGGSGYEHIQPFDPEKLVVTNSAGVLARYLAETVTGAMLAINGNFFRYRAQQQAAVWQPIAFRPLVGQTLAIIGLGQIGSWVARFAKTLGMRVVAVRRRQESVADVDALFPPEELDSALAEADYVSVHVRANDETRHLMNARTFAAMKPGAVFMNTSRGMVVDTPALLAALDSGHLRAAYLDVFETEPLPADDALWAREDVFMMPHSSDNAVQWERRFSEFFADNLARWLAGEPLVNVVEP